MSEVARPEVRAPLHFINREFVTARSGGESWSASRRKGN